MKKRLEAELISIAHRILKLKNKSEVDQLYKETQKLYETLTVLKFYQDNFESVKSDISEEVLEEKLTKDAGGDINQEEVSETKADSSTSEQPEQTIEPTALVETESETNVEAQEEVNISEELDNMPEAIFENEAMEEEIVVEHKPEVKEEPAFKPIFELEADDEEEEPVAAEIASEIQPEEKLEDLIGNYAEPVFVKPNEVSLFPSESVAEEVKEEPKQEPKTAAFNEMTSKSIAIGLNDRIGFVQHLFNDSNEDFNRVISQLNTFDTFEEAKNFINEMVIPDYNYWVGEEEYIERFMEVVEKKFQ